MTPEEFKQMMEKIYQEKEKEKEKGRLLSDRMAHIKADDLLCKVLCELGYEEGIDIFKKITTIYL